MPIKEKRLINIKKVPMQAIGILLVLIAAILLFWTSHVNSNSAIPAIPAQVYFEGEYRIGDGPWQEIVKGQHISSTEGDVTLKGNFHLLAPDGEYIGPMEAGIPVAFCMNHINVTVCESGQEPHVMDTEHPLLGLSACGEMWLAYTFAGDGVEPVELVVHNPHRFGNETAVDDLISNFAIWGGMDFEKDIIASGSQQRNIGLLFIVVSFILLGTALFSTLIHMKNSNIIWLLGLTIVFAGIYFIYSSEGVYVWNGLVVSNTILLVCSVMLYLLFLTISISHLLQRTKKIGVTTTTILGVIDTGIFVLPLFCKIHLYDTLPLWVLVQTVANIVLFGCLIKEFISTKEKVRWGYLGLLLPLIAFELDVVMIMKGYWKIGLASKYVFMCLFAVVVIMVLRIIPHRFNSAAKAKELEIEKVALNARLEESRMATMMSQIRPHFIYNTLGSIEQLCEIDPEKAGELVHNFAKYLRGNFRELDNPKPIRMSQEMEHVRYYISIENVRFPDMSISFELNSEDFNLPALTIQPIVENAIKHGLMKLQKGGSIRIKSYETDTHNCVSVEDDGVGFDTSILNESREHVGIRNIRGRLKEMVGGVLEIESTPGVGTKAVIKIPKEI